MLVLKSKRFNISTTHLKEGSPDDIWSFKLPITSFIYTI